MEIQKLKSAILKVDCYGIYELVKVLKDFFKSGQKGQILDLETIYKGVVRESEVWVF